MMTAMAQQVKDFLTISAPFDTLSDGQLHALCQHASLLYITGDNADDLIQRHADHVFLIQNGQFSVKDCNEPERHLSDGEYFNYPAVMDNTDYSLQVKVDKPGLVFSFTRKAFIDALAHAEVKTFFENSRQNALQTQAVTDSNSMWLYKALSDVIDKPPISVSDTTTIQKAAALMTKKGVSSLLITSNNRLTGIVTDRDLRSRVVAQGVDVSSPVSVIMTKNPAKVANNRTMFDAMSLMSERNIHHLPVIDRATREPVGMVTATDVIRHQRGNVLFIIGELAKADSLYALTRLSWQLPHYFSSHAKRAGDFDIAGKVLSQATDIMTRKLIDFFQREHGKPPMRYCWLVYGSQAREDQTMGSDQDNGLLLAGKPNDQQAGYFAEMAGYVCQGLGKCGIKLCDGNIMASNPQLRLSLEEAVEEAKGWVNAPTSDAIMHFNIFLDVRGVAGDLSLFRQLQQARAPLLKQKMFLAALARHNNDIPVPLSMFQKFVFEKGHSKKDCIDLKVHAVAIINNLVRIYALANGVSVPSTPARLANMPADSGLSSRDRQNLRDIWLFLNRLRWRHQLTQNVTDNRVSVSELSSIEKHQLKAAFKAIERSQRAAVMAFSGGMG